jgi:uncharacterized membrane protein
MNAGILRHAAEVVRIRLWIAPGLSALFAAIAAIVLVEIDTVGWDPLGLDIGPDSARASLSAIATAMISFTALVFSVTMLVLQMASTQLSPRVMRTFLRDRTNQAVLSLFVATFVFALLVLVTITDQRAPQLAIVVAIGLVLTAVLAFVVYIDHMAHTIRSSSVIESITAETRATVEREFPAEEVAAAAPEPASGGMEVTCRQDAGYVVLINTDKLAETAYQADVTIEVLPRAGDFVATGAPLARIHGGKPDDAVAEAVHSAIELADERAMTQDALFGIRQLLDVALRALSPSTNDQTTANQVVDRLGDLLRLLGERPMPSPRVIEREDVARVIVPSISWNELVAWVSGEIVDAGRDHPYVMSHVRDTLQAVATDAPRDRALAIEQALREMNG